MRPFLHGFTIELVKLAGELQKLGERILPMEGPLTRADADRMGALEHASERGATTRKMPLATNVRRMKPEAARDHALDQIGRYSTPHGRSRAESYVQDQKDTKARDQAEAAKRDKDAAAWTKKVK
jgi:hypothetical protein